MQGIQTPKQRINIFRVLLCGTGIGMAIAANKIKGIRAAACNDVESARMARAHNNLNVLTLGGRVLAPGQVPGILDAWLTTPFEKYGFRYENMLNMEVINKLASDRTEHDVMANI